MIRASAPVRICDLGGWTDTWFGAPGRVLNIAAKPGVIVSVGESKGQFPVTLHVEAYTDSYGVFPGAKRRALHPLLEAAIDALPPPGDASVNIVIRSEIPPGCGTGTSASAAVAMLGALASLHHGISAREAAYEAHRLEVDVLGSESGIQDQLSAAMGGVNYIEIDSYPEATIRRLPDWAELHSLITLVFLGKAHNSSELHRQVIAAMSDTESEPLNQLREAAAAGCEAFLARDLHALGRSMILNTQAQRSLHPGLVGRAAHEVIAVASKLGCLGWKVNGAGGDGGSITLLSGTPEASALLEEQITALGRNYRVLEVEPSEEGLKVTND